MSILCHSSNFVSKGRLPEGWEGQEEEGWDQEEDKFINLAPDFVIEIRSKSDSLETLKAKMQEYIENGVRLGWLIDRKNAMLWFIVLRAQLRSIQEQLF